MKKNLWVTVLLLAVVLILPLACKAPAAPAQFEVTSFNISPPEITAGETASITAQVKNTGGSQGVYSATLTVDGAEVEKKDITVAPGATETVTFSLARPKAGTYQAAVGGRSASLTVKPKLVAKEVELKYDDGNADGFSSVGGGYLVDFPTPTIPFTIRKIRLFGSLRGFSQGSFEVEIWDKNRRLLHKEVYPDTKFRLDTAIWVDVEMPNIEVSDKFYVHVWKGPSLIGGMHLGVDESVKNEHSTVTVRTTGITKEVESWKQDYFCPCWFKDKSKANWMIRVVGRSVVPEE